MTEALLCFRCGASLAALSLPIGRRDECPECSIHLHVCKMCVFFDAGVPKQCKEDDAEAVQEKEKVNFCEWFKPSPNAFDPVRAQETADAQSALADLFGDGTSDSPKVDASLEQAEDLFK